MRRLTIYFFYDADGQVDEYVSDCVAAMAEHSERVFVVSNGSLKADSRERLTVMPKVEVSERANEGFDVWAYKHAIDTIGWATLRQYDEVVFMNFTIAGPLYPLSEMFGSMDGRTVDFWGPNVHSGESFDPWGLFPSGRIVPHLQSHFIAVRQRLLQSPALEKYWETMRPVSRYQEAIAFHEAIFTDKFASLGFRWESYVDTSDLDEVTSYPLMFMPQEILVRRRCPFFKRKALFLEFSDLGPDHVASSLGLITQDTVGCLHELGYDLSKIMPNIVRTTNQYDLRLTLNTVRVLRSNQRRHQASAQNVRVLARVHNLVTCLALEHYLPVLQQCAELVVVVDGSDSELDEQLKRRLGDAGVTSIRRASFDGFLTEAQRLAATPDHLLLIGFSANFGDYHPIIEYSFYMNALANLLGSTELLASAVDALGADDELIGALAPAVMATLPQTPSEIWAETRSTVKQALVAADVRVPLSDAKPAAGSASGAVLLEASLLGDVDWTALRAELARPDQAMAYRAFDSLVPFLLHANSRLLGSVLAEEVEAGALTASDYLLASTKRREKDLEQLIARGLETTIASGRDPAKLFGLLLATTV